MENIYETEAVLNQYLLFHYGTAEDQLPYPYGPHDSLFFPQRCVSEFLPNIGKVNRSLDLGCAVGRSTFELSLWSEKVIGIDASHRFIQAAQSICETGKIAIQRAEEGAIFSLVERELPSNIRRQACKFEVGDATAVRPDIGSFDLVLAANLIDRVNSPRKLLHLLTSIVRPGGHLILTSPYTWLDEFTSRTEWIGGSIDKQGGALFASEGLHKELNLTFDHKHTQDLPFLIREHRRKFQWSVAQATVWQRKSQKAGVQE